MAEEGEIQLTTKPKKKRSIEIKEKNQPKNKLSKHFHQLIKLDEIEQHTYSFAQIRDDDHILPEFCFLFN